MQTPNARRARSRCRSHPEMALIQPKVRYFSPRNQKIQINSYLYHKFSSSQNYYFTKDINNILSHTRTSKVIRFYETQVYDYRDEFLRQSYQTSIAKQKLVHLTEYYKFHVDVPRVFMIPAAHVVHRFHDKKRRLNYLKITKMIEGFEPENVKLHDTESGFEQDRHSKLSNYPSLLNIIPPDLKKSFVRNSSKSKPLNRKKQPAPDPNSIATLKELDNVLSKLFKNKKIFSTSLKRALEPHLATFDNRNLAQKVSANINRKTFEGLMQTANLVQRQDSKPLKGSNGNLQNEKSQLKSTINRNQIYPAAIFESLGSNSRLPDRQIAFNRHSVGSKETKPKIIQSLKSQKHDYQHAANGNIQNLNINNLNINFNFGGVTKNNPRGNTKLSLSKELGKASFENSCLKAEPQLCDVKLQSPRFSLLKRFRSSNDANEKPLNNLESHSPREKKSLSSPKAQGEGKSLEKTQIKNNYKNHRVAAAQQKKMANIRNLFTKTSIENIGEFCKPSKPHNHSSRYLDHKNNDSFKIQPVKKPVKSEKKICSFENDLSMKHLNRKSIQAISNEKKSSSNQKQAKYSDSNLMSIKISARQQSKQHALPSQEITSSRALNRQQFITLSNVIQSGQKVYPKAHKSSHSNIALLKPNLAKSSRVGKTKRCGSFHHMKEDGKNMTESKVSKGGKSAGRITKSNVPVLFNTNTMNIVTGLALSLNQLENKFFKRNNSQKFKMDEERVPQTNRPTRKPRAI